MTFFRSLFTFKNKSTPSLTKPPTIIIPSPAPYAHLHSTSNIFLPPYPHEEFPVKVTTPPVSYGYGANIGEKKKSDESNASPISRASNRNTNPFSDSHRLRSSSTSTVNERASTRTSRMASSFSNKESRAERRRTLLLHRQPYRVGHLGLGAASSSSSYGVLASVVPGDTEVDVDSDRRSGSFDSSIASDEPQLDDVDVESIEYTEQALPDFPTLNSILYDTNPEVHEEAEIFVADQSSSQTNPIGSPEKRAPLASRIPRLVKVEHRALTPPLAAPTALTSSEPDSETQRLSVLSISSEQSAASSNTFSFTTGCSSIITEGSFESTNSTDFSASTIRSRRDSTSSTSTIKPKRLPIQELTEKSNYSSASTTKPQYLPAQEHKPKSKSKSSSSSKLDLPPGTFFVSREEYRDYSYVVYKDKKGRLWGKMYPKHKMRKSL